MFSTIASIFASKKAREAERLAKLKEEERKARLVVNVPPQRNPSSSFIDNSSLWNIPVTSYPSNDTITAREVSSSSNFLSEGSGSFSGAGASNSWDDAPTSYSSGYSGSSENYSSCSSD
jgi:hypothetical protein